MAAPVIELGITVVTSSLEVTALGDQRRSWIYHTRATWRGIHGYARSTDGEAAYYEALLDLYAQISGKRCTDSTNE